MTDMEGVGLLFFLVFLGMPLVLLVIATGYLIHRRRSRRPSGMDEPPALTEMKMGNAVKNILLRPDLFFRQATESRPDLFCPFLLVALGSLILCAGYVSLIFPMILYGDIPNLLFLVLGTYPLIVFCAWLGWLALSVFLFAGSAAFKGTGPFTVTLQNTGYGTAFCLLLSGLIQLAGSVINAVYLAMTGGGQLRHVYGRPAADPPCGSFLCQPYPPGCMGCPPLGSRTCQRAEDTAYPGPGGGDSDRCDLPYPDVRVVPCAACRGVPLTEVFHPYIDSLATTAARFSFPLPSTGT